MRADRGRTPDTDASSGGPDGRRDDPGVARLSNAVDPRSEAASAATPVEMRLLRGRRGTGLLIVAALLVATFASGWSLGQPRTSTPATPAADSAEVGFARDMTEHHAQAVEMAEIIRDRTVDPSLRFLARDVALTQQAQIGRMRGWLDQWGVTVVRPGEPMEWAGPMADHEMPTTGRMPGMAERADINALSTAPLAEAERAFLELMIEHHRGGVAMASAVLDRTERVEILTLAEAIVESQRSEIAAMQDLLAQRLTVATQGNG